MRAIDRMLAKKADWNIDSLFLYFYTEQAKNNYEKGSGFRECIISCMKIPTNI